MKLFVAVLLGLFLVGCTPSVANRATVLSNIENLVPADTEAIDQANAAFNELVQYSILFAMAGVLTESEAGTIDESWAMVEYYLAKARISVAEGNRAQTVQLAGLLKQELDSWAGILEAAQARPSKTGQKT